jgi:hypothetical protein
MSNVMRRVLPDDQCQMTFECDPATVIEIGDLLYVASDLVLPAASQADLGTLAQNQEGFHDAFLGVSLSAHRAAISGFVSDNVALDVALEGVFRYPVTSSAGYARGDYVGPEGTGAALAVGMANQLLVKVATPNLAIGRIFRVVSATEVWVEIDSVIMGGGARAAA